MKEGRAVRVEGDVLVHRAFPPDQWTCIHSTNPLEKLDKEIKRRTNVVGIFPDEGSVTRLVGSVLFKVADEWEVGRGCFSQDTLRGLSESEALLVVEPQPLRLAPVH